MNRSRRYGRDVHGILLLDKPKGFSSNDALQNVKRIFRANRAGHTGTLDPLATGMLPICLGEANKFSQYILEADKRYRVVARLGERTNTSDATGEVICTRPIVLNQMLIDATLESFCGKIQQVPSMYSALKYQGCPLYKYARRGVEIPRKSRMITIYEIKFIRWQNNELELEIYCSKGTYIRTVIDDLGEKLGCGAHVIMLRRIQVAQCQIEKMVTFEQLYALQRSLNSSTLSSLDALLMPIDSLVVNYPEVNISVMAAGYFKQGKPVFEVVNLPRNSLVRVTEGETRKFIGMAKIIDDNHVAPYRLIA